MAKDYSGLDVATTLGAILAAAVIIVGLILGFAALSAWFTMIMVNYLFTATVLTVVFGTAKIGFWQAFTLNVLTATLFKSVSYGSSKK